MSLSGVSQTCDIYTSLVGSVIFINWVTWSNQSSVLNHIFSSEQALSVCQMDDLTCNSHHSKNITMINPTNEQLAGMDGNSGQDLGRVPVEERI